MSVRTRWAECRLVFLNAFYASILIVDDQEANVQLLWEMLRDAGYACIASTNDPYEVCALLSGVTLSDAGLQPC